MSSILWSNPVNRSHPLNRGLVSWWLNTPHARGGTTFRDLQGSNHGTLTQMDPATDWVTSNRSNSWGALAFDGTDDSVNCGDIDAIKGQSQLTISLWAKQDTLKDFAYLVSKATGGGANRIIMLTGGGFGWHENDDIGFVIEGAEFTGQMVTDSNAWTAGEWRFVTGVFDGTQTGDQNRIKIYFEASLQSRSLINTAVPSTTPSSTDAVIFGTDDGTADHFNGQLDDIRIYNRALNASEVRQLYNLSRTGYGDLFNRRRMVFAVPAAGGGGGRIMGSLAGYGGLAGVGGLAGRGGGIAG